MVLSLTFLSLKDIRNMNIQEIIVKFFVVILEF